MFNGIGSTAGSMQMSQLLDACGATQAGQVAGDDESDSSGNSLSSLISKVKMAQNSSIDKASTVLDLLRELKDSDNPALARIGKELNQVDSRIGGTFSEAKQDYLLKQALALLTAQLGGSDAQNFKQDKASTFHGTW